jgi:hypothetical protein
MRSSEKEVIIQYCGLKMGPARLGDDYGWKPVAANVEM